MRKKDLTFILQVAESIISAIKEFNGKKPPMPLLISFDDEEVRKQAAASAKRFEEGISELQLMIYSDSCVNFDRVKLLLISYEICGY